MTTPATAASTSTTIAPLHAPVSIDLAANLASQPFATPTLRILRLSPRAILPAYHSPLAAGLDLAACIDPELDAAGGLLIPPVSVSGASVLVPCGFAMALPPGFEAQVRPRSGLSTKSLITLPNAPGTIDADYRGQVFVPLVNLSLTPFHVRHGLRIAQMVIAPIAHAQVLETDSLDSTARGSGGFGSTGLSSAGHPSTAPKAK